MKLIVENNQYGCYAYIENEKHHKVVEPNRGAEMGITRRPIKDLEKECDLENFPNSYFVFSITKKQPKYPK